MATLILAGGSPTAAAYAGFAAGRVPHARLVLVRELNARALLRRDPTPVADLLRMRPEAVVVVAAVRRAATSGLLRTLVEFLDVRAPVLPVAVGSFAAHARVLDHALLPLLGPQVLPTVFLPEHHADLDVLTEALATLTAQDARARLA